MLRRSLIVGGLAAAAGHRALAKPLRRGAGGSSGGLSPDGSDLIGQPGGGGIGTPGNTSLVTTYGTFTMSSMQATQPGYGGGTFNEIVLNGKPFCPAAPIGVFGFPPMQQLRINYGGRIFGINFDQIWNEVTNYSWQGNDGSSLAGGPLATPVYAGPPTYAPPYTPSAENTSISGGTGSLQTADGIFTFGVVNGAGYDLKLNGLPMELGWQDPLHFAVNLATVYGVGQLFFRTTDAVWHLWAGFQPNPSTGPTAAPVPIYNIVTPGRPVISSALPLGSHVADIAVTMSDGSGFTGVHALDNTTYFTTSGNTIITNATPPVGSQFTLTSTQNGSGFQRVMFVTTV